MKKRGISITTIFLAMVLCGCVTSGEAETAVPVKQEVQEDKGFRKPNQEQTLAEEETQMETDPLGTVSLWEKDEYASTILEDETALYFIGEDHIRKIEKESGTEQYIWESPTGRKVDSKWIYDSARGILLNDRIYFIEKWESQEKQEETTNYALSVVCTDGTGYERITKVQADLDEVLILLDGVLYYEKVRNSYSLNGYSVNQAGVLDTEKMIVAEVKNIPEGYGMPYYYQNGSRILTPSESVSRFGYYLMRNPDYHLCKIDPKSGTIERMPDYLEDYSLHAMNEKFLLFVSYVDNQIYLYENSTGAVRILGVFDSNSNIIAMDEEFLYLQRTVYGDDFTQHHYEKIALKSGKVTELFVTDKMTGLGIDEPKTLMDIAILNGYLYYPGEQDYKLFVMRRALEMPNAEEILGSDFYDSRISEVGSIKTYQETIYSQKAPEKVAAALNLEWLVVDKRYPGAANINQLLEEEQQQNIAYEHDNAKMQDEWYTEDMEYMITAFSLDSHNSPIYYWDGTYLSFVQQSYDYSGGAHGMPYWNGYVFNVQTGAKLGLVDIVSDDEIQIKGLVTQYFTEMYNENPDMYWDGAVDTVFEYTTLDSQFYLTEEGIVFYFGPYDLAPYAAGFQEIVVPYSAWNLKIELEY